MKIKGMDGEYAFKALYQLPGKVDWLLSESYFFSIKEFEMAMPEYIVKWPVEIDEHGVVYIPSEEELDNDK